MKLKKSKSELSLMIAGIAGMVGGIICFIVSLVLPTGVDASVSFPDVSLSSNKDAVYSKLTGLEISPEFLNAPAYCIQTPNGTDGGRPQAGMDQAGVIFEAIAEAGITRFAAIYQNPSSAVIGPIRSLRLYYLQWDTPFDCTIVHAGGADDALAAVRSGGYKDLTENYSYMYRGSAGERRWNNLFTTASLLSKMSADRGYGGSDIKGFSRMTPEESSRDRVEALTKDEGFSITQATRADTSAATPEVEKISIRFGNWASFNVNYTYNVATNSYDRSYETGAKHEIYVCPKNDLGKVNPEATCELKQMSPAVVVAIIVKEKKASDNYHEDITTVGSGEAYIFQNGYTVRGVWQKASVSEQIKFYDLDGKEIKLAPGQTFIEAIPSYGSVNY